MNFKQFKKELEEKREQEKTMQELRGAIATLQKKRDNYAERAKEALRSGNNSQYTAMVALLKNSIFYLKQAQDMEANYMIAKDLCEMQNLSRRFVKSLDSIMVKVQKTCKAIHVSNTEKNFTKALHQQSETSNELQQALQANNVAFACSVNQMSDIGDDEIKTLLQDEIKADEGAIDSQLDELESMLLGDTAPRAENLETSLPEIEVVAPVAPSASIPTAAQTSPAPILPIDPTPTEIPTVSEAPTYVPTPEPIPMPSSTPEPAAERRTPEDELLGEETGEDGFVWDNIPAVGFDDIAGLEEVKEVVQIKVLLPLKNPEAFAGYEKKNGGGLCLYGPPGTGKTMIAAAIAHEIGAKFCSVKPSDLLQQGAGNTEKAVRNLFKQARQFPCAVIYFDEMDSISPKSTRSQYAKQLRSEFLAQLQGAESYGKDNGNLLFLICSTNKPWDIDSAFLRPGRFGTRVYVGLPDEPARKYMINKRLEKIRNNGVVRIDEDINIDDVTEKTNGFNGSDISNLLDKIEEISIVRGIRSGEKYICANDFAEALEKIHSSVQTEDIVKLKEWRLENDS